LLIVALSTNLLVAASPGRYFAGSVRQQKMSIGFRLHIDDASCLPNAEGVIELAGCGYLLIIVVFSNSFAAASPGRYFAGSVRQQKMCIGFRLYIDDGSYS